MSKFDDVFKERLRKSFLVAAQTVFGQDFDKINERPIELRKQIKRKADFLFETVQNGINSFVHIEIQTRNDPKMLKRMLMYLSLLYDRYGLPVKQFVLFLGKKKNAKSTMVTETNLGLFTYRYELVNVSDVSYEVFLENKETLIFAILGNFNGDKDVEVIEKILLKTAKYFSLEEEIKEFFADLLILSSLRNLERQVLLKTKSPNFMPLNIDITKTITYKEGKLEGKLEGKFDIAKEMLIEGMSVAQIQKFTKLSVEQINEIEVKIQK